MNDVDRDEEDEDDFVRVDDITPNQIKEVPKGIIYNISFLINPIGLIVS